MLAALTENAFNAWANLRDRMERLTKAQKIAIGVIAILHVIGAAVFMLVGGDSILQCTVLAHSGIARMATWMRSSWMGILALYIAMCITAIPPISGFGTCVTMAGMAFASIDASEPRAWSHSASKLVYGWIIASFGMVLSSSISFMLLQTLLSRLHGQWEVLSVIKSDRRFRALQRAVKERGLWMAVLAR